MTEDVFAIVEGEGGGGRYARSAGLALDDTLSETGEEERKKGESFTEFLLGRVIGCGAAVLSREGGKYVVSCLEETKEGFLSISKGSCRVLFAGDDGVADGCTCLVNRSEEVARKLSGVEERDSLSDDGEPSKSCLGSVDKRDVPYKD